LRGSICVSRDLFQQLMMTEQRARTTDDAADAFVSTTVLNRTTAPYGLDLPVVERLS